MGLRRAGEHIYNSKRWRRLRFLALRRDGFACVKCGARGVLEVDHIESIRRTPQRAFDLSNLQSLCISCHSKKTNAEMGRVPIAGRAAWDQLVNELSKGKTNA